MMAPIKGTETRTTYRALILVLHWSEWMRTFVIPQLRGRGLQLLTELQDRRVEPLGVCLEIAHPTLEQCVLSLKLVQPIRALWLDSPLRLRLRARLDPRGGLGEVRHGGLQFGGDGRSARDPIR